MADVSDKLTETIKMVEYGDYFIINRPRQYGKTTTLFTIAEQLRAKVDYIVINTSFEGIAIGHTNEKGECNETFAFLNSSCLVESHHFDAF